MAASSALALELELEPFSGPFDLLLALVLRDVVDLGEVPVADVCLRYLAQIEEEGEIDLESASEFLVLVAALLELKIRLLLAPDEVDELPDAQEAAEELAARLAEYARAQAAAQWLGDRLDEVGRRIFRDGPPALRPPRPQLDDEATGDPHALAAALRLAITRTEEASEPIHVLRRRIPLGRLLDHVRRAVRATGSCSFDDAVRGLGRAEQAAAFWAVLDLIRGGEVIAEQDAPFAPIRMRLAGRSTTTSTTTTTVQEAA
ncbi:MAG: segregation/condensation protein A [Gaiellales bacterium]